MFASQTDYERRLLQPHVKIKHAAKNKEPSWIILISQSYNLSAFSRLFGGIADAHSCHTVGNTHFRRSL